MKLQLHVFITVLIMPLFLPVDAQHRFEIGIEGGPISTHYTMIDPGNKLSATSCMGGYGGINFRFNTQQHYFIEVGLLATEHWAGFKIKNGSALKNNSDAVMLLPVRFGYEFELSKKISLVPVAGFSPVIKTLSQDGSSSVYDDADITLVRTARVMGKDFYLLLLAGAMLELKAGNKMKLCFGTSYYRGLTNVVVWDIDYQRDSEPARTAQLKSKGGFTNGQVSVKYLLK